jgi:hypothetical protein
VARPAGLIYALGGGLGHLTRACALARAGFAEIHFRILTNSPYAAVVRRAMPELDLIALDPAMSVEEGRTGVLREIAAAHADCLVVDTFPRGLGGELASSLSTYRGMKVLVQRDIHPRYILEYDLNAFVKNSYDLVLVPGDTTADGLGPFPQSVTTAPWLIRSCHEVLPGERARRVLGLEGEKACIVVCAAGVCSAGKREELAWYGAVVSQLVEYEAECDVRCVAPVRPEACPPEQWVSYWPAMDLYAAADVVIGGAGYNTIYECVACGVPSVAKAWPRKYDRQHLRACRAARIADEPSQAVAAAMDLIRTPRCMERRRSFENGASQAIARIRQHNGDI